MRVSKLLAVTIALLLAVSWSQAQDTPAPPAAEQPKAEEPKKEEPKAEEPKKEEPKPEEPKKEEPKKEEPKKEEPKKEEPKKEEPKKEEPKKEEPKAETPKIQVKVETLLENLNNPTGIAVQPETGMIYVADSGNLKIVRIDPKTPNKSEDVVTGFTKDVYGKGPMYDIGPLGLAFVDKDTLVVGDGGKVDGEELVRLYKVPEAGKVLDAEKDMLTKLGPIAASDKSAKGEGNFYAVAVTPEAIYVTSNGDDTKGWLLKATKSGDKWADLAPYIATKEAVQIDAPVGIAINRKGHIVVGQMGEISVPKDSHLSFYSPKSGKLLMDLKTDLNDITALAYSPIGRLYAADFAWADAKEGGLFRIERVEGADGKQACQPVLVEKLDKPTAMVFDGEGNLYVTVFGTAADGATTKPGKLLKITGDL